MRILEDVGVLVHTLLLTLTRGKKMEYKREYTKIENNMVDLPEDAIVIKLEDNIITYLTPYSRVIKLGDRKRKEKEYAQISDSLSRESVSILK